jgi:hypothetical protein
VLLAFVAVSEAELAVEAEEAEEAGVVALLATSLAAELASVLEDIAETVIIE